MKNNSYNQTFIFAHSLAGFEAAYLLPILEEYLTMNEAKTKLSLILVQAGGQYDQSAIKFTLWKAPLWNLFLDEIRELYPSPNDQFNLRKRLSEARRAGNKQEVDKLSKEVEDMEVKINNPHQLDESTKQRLARLDGQIAAASGLDKFRLEVERHALLWPIIDGLNGGARFSEPLMKVGSMKLFWRVFRANIPEVVRRVPLEVRKLHHGIIVRILGESDLYFPADEVLAKGAEFPHATEEVTTIPKGSHQSPLINAPQFAEIAVQIMGRSLR